jgi:uncharacterized protein
VEKKIELHLQGLTSSQIQSGAYALVLMEENGKRHIPIVVGTAEAQSIAIALEGVSTPRPLTHDLIVSMANKLELKLKQIFIYKFEDGVFFSELWFIKGSETIKIDSRTSDAIAVALRMKAPIFTTKKIIEECGVDLDEEPQEETVPKESSDEKGVQTFIFGEPEELTDEHEMNLWISQHETEELREHLQKAINEENYELAKKFQDEIDRRESEKNKK